MQKRSWIGRAATVMAVTAAGVFSSGGPALAARGGGGGTTGSSSLTLVLLDSTDGVAHWGQRITFEVSTTQTTQPQVSVECYQGGSLVYTMFTGYWDGYKWPWTQIMTLRSAAWTGGAADCSAKMYYSSGRKTVTGATLSFHAAA